MKPFAFLLLLSCVLLSSCYQLYKPVGHRHTTMPTPNMQNAKQVYAMATAGLEHIELQAAYSPIKNLAVYGGIYQGYSWSEYFQDIVKFFKPPVLDVGLGYYDKNKYCSWEVYGIFTNASLRETYTYSGQSILYSDFNQIQANFKASYNSYSLLANSTFHIINNLDLSTSLKYELQHYSVFSYVVDSAKHTYINGN
ncbi:MAG: hypothetical protein NTX03_10250, partial [Bacteroidetes bacterium]|nr:hypothetical protein [Bacteroidota bacterium]